MPSSSQKNSSDNEAAAYPPVRSSLTLIVNPIKFLVEVLEGEGIFEGEQVFIAERTA